MKILKPRLLLMLFVGLCLVPMLQAMPVYSAEAVQRTERFQFEGGFRYQQGSALELVYDGPFVLSELNWDIKDLLFVGGTFRFHAHPRLGLVASYWVGVTEGTGGMTDYDFLIPGVWTDFSEGPVDINSASMLDLYLDWAFYRGNPVSLHVLAGYQQLDWDWSQYGGSFMYSEFGGFRNYTGTFDDDENGINYEQTFQIPYAGLALEGQQGNWAGRAYIQYSSFVQAEAFDEHVLRDLYFTDNFEDLDYLGLGLALQYRFGRRGHIGLAWDWHDIPEGRGDALILDAVQGVEEFDAGGAGIANTAWSLSLTAGVRF
jgi:outer membrane protease